MAYNKKKKMMEQVHTIVDRLSEVIGNMQKCLECTICLHTISDPVKTLCGHRFCRLCIQRVLQNKNAHCPLCNTAIHRRSITRDEHMVLYIDRLEKLIQSIQLDSGIDILSHLPRPRGTLETHASDKIESCKNDGAEQIKPGCSYNTSLPRKQSVSHSNRSTQRQLKVYKRHTAKHKTEKKEGSSITRYLTKCAISGVEPLPPDESNDPLNEKSMEEKVNSWLENLPEADKFDDPNRNSPVQLREFNLDDTLITSVSQNCPGNKLETSQKDANVAVAAVEESNSRSSMTKRYSRSSLRDEKNENTFNDKEQRSRDSQTRTAERNGTRREWDMEDPKPSTSGRTKSSVDREKSQERCSDVRRTSPGDLLPAMKKNWSSVKEFGKEMRTKRKKLKSLNVSIESKGRSRSIDEPAANISRGEIIETDVTESLNNRRRNSPKTPENVTKPLLDKEFFVGEKSSAENKDALEENVSPRSACNKSMQEGVRMPGESSFITLEEGEQVHIRNLNSTQMNDIIGVAENNDEPEDVEMVTENSPKRKYDVLTSTPLGNQFKALPYATPAKSPALQGRDNMHSDSNQKDADLSCSDTVLHGFTPPSRGRLSLKKSSVDQKTNDSFGSNSDSRLQAIRRNLNHGLDQSMEYVGERGRNVEEVGAAGTSTDLGTNLGTDTENIRRVNDLPGVSNDLSDAKKECNDHKRALVTFKKLGKTYKHRKKRVRFSYLGPTSCEFFHRCPSLNKQKPCNPIDVLDTQDLEGDFGNFAQITVNNTPTAKEFENSNMEAAKELEESASKIQESPNNKQEIVEQRTSKTLAEIDNNIAVQSQESDVLIVTLDENEQIFHLPVAHPTKSPEKTPTNTAIKMLSPAKDSQLQFLSLESPTIGNFESQELIGRCELVKDNSLSEIRAPSSALIRTSQRASRSSECPCTPQRKRKRSKSRENVLHRMKKHGDNTNDDYRSLHSFSSQVTCVRNSNKVFLPISKKNTTERCQSSSTKDINNVSLSSDMDTLPDGEGEHTKVYRRIVPLVSSGTSSPDLISLNNTPSNQRVASPTTKRKRGVSPDSDVEADLNVIVSSWYEDAKPGDRYKKKGKLEETRDPLNSMSASREARNNSSSGSCSNDRNRGANKLSEWQNRRPVGFVQNSAPKKSDFAEIERRQRVEDRVELVVVDEDSPDFGATIDKMKDIRNRGFFDGKQDDLKADNLLQDNFDEIIANVVTDSLIDNCCDGKDLNVGKESNEFLEEYRCNENTLKSKKDFVRLSSDASDKENAYTNLAPPYDINDDTDKTLTPEHKSVSNKNSRLDKFGKKIWAVQLPSNVESMSIESNKSMVPNSAAPFDHNKPPINESVANDSMVKDTCEQDSLMNITQHYLMIKQFEDDLFGKPKSSNAVSEKEQAKRGQQTPQKKKKEGFKKNAKDVEQSGEEDDIVENTPDTKTKTRSIQAVNSPKESPRVSSLSQMFTKQFPDKSPASTCKKSSTGVSTPACKRKMHPLYQSTPKAERSIRNNNYSAAKTVSTINESFSIERRPAVRSNAETIRSAQSPQNSVAQGFCFVCSGLLPAQIDHVKKLSTMVNGKYVTQFDREVTHVIVKANKESNGANKTLKYLQGIAHRKWIVSYQWVVDSLKASSLINEEPYEVVDSTTLEAGPRKSRLREKNLFEGFVFLCIGPYDDVSVEQYHDLLRATGAFVVDSLDALAAEKKRLKIIVIQADVYNYEIIEWYKKARAIPIVHDWVIECISQHKLISFYPYLQELSRQDVLELGYPEYLVEEEADGDSDSVCDESS